MEAISPTDYIISIIYYFCDSFERCPLVCDSFGLCPLVFIFFAELTLNPPEGIIAGPMSEDNFFEWEALIM